jgi:hypothetical protein
LYSSAIQHELEPLEPKGNTSGNTPGKTYIFIRKYQEISGNTKKFQEIP